ncbi:MAG: hypothetical protein JWM35_2203 [Verrucomicrobia bacterium]|nr:hypothetical protein [Verrucomicrobiota bacterium]
MLFRLLRVPCVAAVALMSGVVAHGAPEKPLPDARFGNWLYKTPDAAWKRTESNGNLVFSIDAPPGDYCLITLFAGAKAESDFATQFNRAVTADQQEKGTVKIEADTGAKPAKAIQGYDVLTRSLRSETNALHTFHAYVAGHSGDRFDLMAFQTTSEESWKRYGAQAGQFILSLKLANSIPAAEVEKLVGHATPAGEPPPSIPGLDDATAPAAVEPAPEAAPAAAQAEIKIPDRPLAASSIVVKNAVVARNGKPINGLKLSQHDTEIYSPSIAVAANGVIHIAFVEKHRTTYALAVYHRSSSDGGKTWTDAKNLSEDMPGIQVGRCFALVDARQRVYIIWRAGLTVNFQATPDPAGTHMGNLMYRVLENGKWSRIVPVHAPGSPQSQDDGSLAYFAAIDAAGHAQVVWNAIPDKWHPELTKISGVHHQHLAGVGSGLVFQSTLDGASPATPREIFMTAVAGQEDMGGYGTYCDGLDALNGYVDAAGAAHFVAAVGRTHDSSLAHKSVYELIENHAAGPMLELPDLSYHAWRDIPTLLVDAAGQRHYVVLYPFGERPSIRDYLVGSDEEPVIIRQAAAIKGTVDGMQAFQGPGGRMIAIMQMNDSGERANGETYISISTGKGWSTPVNVTNNYGRQSFVSKQTGIASNIAIEKSYYPGIAAATYDREGHLLLLMINNEYGLFGSSAFGVTISGGSSSTPTLQFLKF